jgi:sigma-B regulation protein RsbU (phosphoserine phosphatase)
LYTRPANDVGGDLVDYLRIDGERACIVLGDVAGKGLPAALLMAKLQATIRALAPEFGSLAEIGARVNTILVRDGLPNRFATMVYLELRPGTGNVRVLNAGHMPPLVVRGDEMTELPRGSLALGLLPEATFEEQCVNLLDGDTLLVYSDGATEAMNPEGDFFGDERLRALLPTTSHLPVAELGASLVTAVRNFVGSARPHDDISFIVLRRRT